MLLGQIEVRLSLDHPNDDVFDFALGSSGIDLKPGFEPGSICSAQPRLFGLAINFSNRLQYNPNPSDLNSTVAPVESFCLSLLSLSSFHKTFSLLASLSHSRSHSPFSE